MDSSFDPDYSDILPRRIPVSGGRRKRDRLDQLLIYHVRNVCSRSNDRDD